MSKRLATAWAWARTAIQRARAASAARARTVGVVLRWSARRRQALLWLLPAPAAYGLWALLGWKLPPTAPAGSLEFFAQRREFLTLYFGIIAGMVALGGVWLAWRRVIATEEGQITERFTRAVAQLGDDKLVVRLGAVYALERIAGDSQRDHWNIMELLTAFVRENARWQDATPATGANAAQPNAQPDRADPRPRADIQAILTVIGRRPEERRKKEPHFLDLRGTDLRGAALTGAHLERAALTGAHLERAALWGAHLEGASLWGAHLERADLIRAHLEGVSLWGAHLEGADLRSAMGLTVEQVNQAYLDAATRLPDYLPRDQVKGRQG